MIARLACGVALALVGGCAGGGEPGRQDASEQPASEAPTAPPEVETSTAAIAPTTVPPPAPATVALRLDHYAIEPSLVTAPAGALTVAAENVDGVPHDVMLLWTELRPDALPTAGVRVDEADPAVSVLGRTPRLAAGESGAFTVSLRPGTYVLVCTVPHHYVREAMVATLTLTG